MLSDLLHVDLSESYVLQWLHDGQKVIFDLDFVLLPDHSCYRPPAPEEWACYRKGHLMFKNCTSVIGFKEIDMIAPAFDASGETDYGHIEMFAIVDRSSYRLVGEFGDVQIVSSEPEILFLSV